MATRVCQRREYSDRIASRLLPVVTSTWPMQLSCPRWAWVCTDQTCSPPAASHRPIAHQPSATANDCVRLRALSSRCAPPNPIPRSSLCPARRSNGETLRYPLLRQHLVHHAMAWLRQHTGQKGGPATWVGLGPSHHPHRSSAFCLAFFASDFIYVHTHTHVQSRDARPVQDTSEANTFVSALDHL